MKLHQNVISTHKFLQHNFHKITLNKYYIVASIRKIIIP